MNLKDAITKRRSIKHFDKYKSVDWKKIVRAIDYARFAPTAGNKFINKFILVSDEKKIKELATASGQDFVANAKYAVIVVSDEKTLVRSYEERGVRYAAQQSGAAIQNFLLGLTEQKLSTIWVGHFYPEQIHRVFKIPEKLKIEAFFPIGKEQNIKTKPKSKEKLENYLYFEKYGKSKMN